jgi:hypothetical protein
MQRVLDAVDERGRQYERTGIFRFVNDTTLDARRRLSFAPYLTHFVMSFSDFYSHILNDGEPNDELQKLVTQHTEEDSEHWKWFLRDLETLGLNPTLPFTDAVKLLYSPAALEQRMLCYKIAKLGYGADAVTKLVLILCIETAGKVSAVNICRVGDTLAREEGTKLVYFGNHHLQAEDAHTIEDASSRARVDAVRLDPAREEALVAMVNEVFDHFDRFAEETLKAVTVARTTDPQVATFQRAIEARERSRPRS